MVASKTTDDHCSIPWLQPAHSHHQCNYILGRISIHGTFLRIDTQTEHIIPSDLWSSPLCRELFCHGHPTTKCLFVQLGQIQYWRREKQLTSHLCVFSPCINDTVFPNNVLLPWQYDVYLWRWNNRYVIPTFCWLAQYPENNVLEVGLHQRANKFGIYPIFGFVGHHYDWNLHLCFDFVWRFVGNMYKATRVAVWAAGLATKISMSRKHCEICERLLGRKRSRPSRPGCIQLDPGYLLYLRRGNGRSRPCASFL